MTIDIDEELCLKHGLDPKKVKSIATRISKAALEAQELGLHIFGGSGSGALRISGKGGNQYNVAHLQGSFDGGDGGDDY